MRVLAVINAVIRDVATRSDLESLGDELREEIQGLRKELRGDIESLGQELEGDIRELRGEIQDLRGEMSRNFRWTMGAIITVWGATVIPMLLRLVGLL